MAQGHAIERSNLGVIQLVVWYEVANMAASSVSRASRAK
jgi:hypothetical protein